LTIINFTFGAYSFRINDLAIDWIFYANARIYQIIIRDTIFTNSLLVIGAALYLLDTFAFGIKYMHWQTRCTSRKVINLFTIFYYWCCICWTSFSL